MEVLRRYVFGGYVFSREAFNSMNDSSGQDSQECWLERKKRLRARLRLGPGNRTGQSGEEGSQASLKEG